MRHFPETKDRRRKLPSGGRRDHRRSAAGSRACAAAVLAAASLTGLIKKTITIYTGQEEDETAGFRPSGKSAVTAAAASAVLTAAAAAVAAGSQGSVPGENTVVYWLTCWSSVNERPVRGAFFSGRTESDFTEPLRRAAKDGIILRSARLLEKLSGNTDTDHRT